MATNVMGLEDEQEATMSVKQGEHENEETRDFVTIGSH
jgi:hypothetical protein